MQITIDTSIVEFFQCAKDQNWFKSIIVVLFMMLCPFIVKGIIVVFCSINRYVASILGIKRWGTPEQFLVTVGILCCGALLGIAVLP